MFATNQSPIREYRDLVKRELLALLQVQPGGFYLEELADRIGLDRRASSREGRRLRHQLELLCLRNVLFRIDRGVYVAGDADISPKAADLSAMVWNAFWYSGGIMSMPELMAEIAGPGIDRRIVRNHLAGSDKYVRGLPLDGYRNHWRVNDALRSGIPLPGHLHLLELKIMRLRAGLHTSGWGILPNIALQAHIGSAIRNAREFLDIDPRDLAGNKSLLATLDVRLRMATWLRPTDPAMGDKFGTFAGWWTEAVREHGREGAFVLAWYGMEGDDPRLTGLLTLLDVRCWVAMGAALGCDPAALSRGAIS